MPTDPFDTRPLTATGFADSELLDLVINQFPGMVFIKDHQHRFIGGNKAFATLAGLDSIAAIIGRKDCEMPWAAEAEKYVADDRAVMESDQSKLNIIETITLPDGSMRHIETSKLPFRDEDGRLLGVIGFLIDITDRIAANAALTRTRDELKELVRDKTAELRLAVAKEKSARREAEQADRLKGEFLANMSHEIRTPINGIIGMTELLLQTPLNSKQHGYARAVLGSADNLLTIINDILDISKIEASTLELDASAFNLTAVIDDLAELLAIRAREKAVELIIRVAPDVQRSLVGDAGRLRQVLANVIGNAIKFTERGHVLLSVETIERMEGESIVQFTVSDTGIGIRPDALHRIFRKFSQADASMTRRFGGTGLGLTISRQLVEAMQGTICVTSHLNAGSHFTVTLPFAHAETRAPDMPAPAILRGASILLVDDVKENADVLRDYLEKAGVSFSFYTSAAEAAAAVKQASDIGQPFDIAIIDYLLPEKNGEDLARSIRADSTITQPALVMLTAAETSGYNRHIREAGFNALVHKPVRMAQMMDLLALTLDQYRKGSRNTLFEAQHLQSAKATLLDDDAISFNAPVVLLADDNRVNQAIIDEMLQKLGCRVVIAGNGQEVVDIVSERAIDLILMDCRMPILDGYEASRQIAALHHDGFIPAIHVIALTANNSPSDRDECLRAGMHDYLAKPLRRIDLIRKLLTWLPNHVIRQTGTVVRYDGQSCLLVEDNRINAAMAMQILTDMGLKVDLAVNGEEACRQLQASPYDLILMDCQMPVLDGFEATRRIREAGHVLPIIALTANAMAGDRERCLEAGMNDYISKPARREHIQDSIARWLPPSQQQFIDSDPDDSPCCVDLGVFQDCQTALGDGFADMIQLYLANSDRLIAALQNGDRLSLSDVVAIAHTLKSTSLTLGATGIGELAGEIEQDGRDRLSNGQTDTVIIPAYRFAQLKAAYAEIERFLLRQLARNSAFCPIPDIDFTTAAS